MILTFIGLSHNVVPSCSHRKARGENRTMNTNVMMKSSNGNIFRVTGHLYGEFTGHRFDVFFDLPLNKRLSKQWRGWWFETPSHPLWRHCNGYVGVQVDFISTITMTSQWALWHLKSPVSPLFARPFVQAHIKENIKAPCHWPLSGESTGDRWIPLTKGQWRGKCFHVKTSWCPHFGSASFCGDACVAESQIPI